MARLNIPKTGLAYRTKDSPKGETEKTVSGRVKKKDKLDVDVRKPSTKRSPKGKIDQVMKGNAGKKVLANLTASGCNAKAPTDEKDKKIAILKEEVQYFKKEMERWMAQHRYVLVSNKKLVAELDCARNQLRCVKRPNF